MHDMRAVVVQQYGGPEVLQFTHVEPPKPAADGVTIAVEAAAVGLIDVLFRRDGLRGLVSPPFIPGIEVAGRVAEVGADVQGLVPGQAVVTLSNPGTSGYAEVAAVPASLVIPLDAPNGRAIEPALAVAAVPNVVTALAALGDAARMRPGDDVLVFGATGGLGSVFPGVANSLGARTVTAVVTRPENVGRARAYGFTEVILMDEIGDAMQTFDVVVDPVGGAARQAALSLLRPLGRVVAVGNASDAEQISVGTNDLWLGNAGVVGLNIAGLLATEPERARILATRAIDLILHDRIRTEYETLPLEDAAAAHQRMEDRSVIGRLVLTP